MSDASTVLSIRGLTLEATIRSGTALPVTDAHVSVRSGEIVGLVGESGSGKTLTALSALSLLPSNIRRVFRMTAAQLIHSSVCHQHLTE